MIDHLSPREVDDLRAAEAAGEAWPGLLRRHFLDGTRLRLGWNEARGENEMLPPIEAAGGAAPAEARAAIRAGLERAARWCTEHGLHFLSYEGDGLGAEPLGERRWFMAVG